MKSLAAVMLVYNEEEFVADAIRNILPFVDSMTVIDQNSTDDTARILKSIPGVRYIWHRGNFKDCGEQYFRTLAAQITDADWMCYCDADEILSDDWSEVIRPMIDQYGDDMGMIEVQCYHLMGSYEYHEVRSPLWTPRFVRLHKGLCGGPPMAGSFAHSGYIENMEPKRIHKTERVQIFHLGYLRRDLMFRWRRNVLRGDYTPDMEAQAVMLQRMNADPICGFAGVVPLDMPLEKYPAVIRDRVNTSYEITYDPIAKKLLGRKPL